MELDNIIIIVISVVVAIILTKLFFNLILPVIVFLVLAYFVYQVLNGWDEKQKYQ